MRARWEKMAEDMETIKVPRSLPPLAKLFQEHIQEFFGISAWSEGKYEVPPLHDSREIKTPTTS